MYEEINAYEKYLLDFGVVERPKMPKFDLLAYTDNEYTLAIGDLLNDFNSFDDECLTIAYLKGD